MAYQVGLQYYIRSKTFATNMTNLILRVVFVSEMNADQPIELETT